MKSDSPLFDKIRVTATKDRRKKKPSAGPKCQWSGCEKEGAHRAPRGRGNEKEYWRFCLEHVRQYNQNYNFFAGMNHDDVLKYQKDALTGHRPTWKMGTGKRGKPDLGGAFDPLHMFEEIGGRAGPEQQKQSEQRTVRNVERKHLETLGLEVGVTKVEVKTRFKELVKKHHPDANGGDKSSEDRLVEIIQSYNYLKSVGLG
ncbi:MAG: DnaJ domain-containing protein [Pseudolabrys sp.]|nr:DnaJ domain-containing protein [Pseudolabrys sp.]MBV9954960.1 DnaJ domain-containing protein [Pseudolabrys sp.]